MDYSSKVESEIKVSAKRQMKNVEGPTGEKSMFGFGKEITKTKKEATKNVVISESDYKKLVTAAQDNQKLKKHISNLLNTDMAKAYKNLSKEHDQVKEKHNGLVKRYNEIGRASCRERE